MNILDGEDLIKTIRATSDPVTLREYLRQVEAAIKEIVGDDPSDFFHSYPSWEQLERIDDLLHDRQCILDHMFMWSKAEVEHIERSNTRLYELYVKMYKRTASLYRCMLAGGKDADFDDCYEVEGWLNCDVLYEIVEGKATDYGTVLHTDEDNHYGSHFAYMIYVLQEYHTIVAGGMQYIDNCFIGYDSRHTPEMSDEELGCDYKFLDDGTTWAEYHRRPEIDHIAICHSFHSMFDHHRYSLADIIRVNRFMVETKVACQRVTDVAGRRWEEIREEMDF